jgi:hypothetical protein
MCSAHKQFRRCVCFWILRMILRLEREFCSLHLTTFCVLLICLHNLAAAAVKLSKLKAVPFRMSCHVQNNLHTLRILCGGQVTGTMRS